VSDIFGIEQKGAHVMKQQNILIIGQGAREHALCQALAQSPLVAKLWASPGNPGMAELATLAPIQGVQEWVNLADEIQALTIVGPEVPLADGIIDALTARGLLAVGPSQAGAKLESSKIYAKSVMTELAIPTARSQTVQSVEQLQRVVEREWSLPFVVKEDGLAQGKGVAVIAEPAQWQDFLRRSPLSSGPFVVEEYLEGREVSVEILTNGHQYVWLPTAADHKRLTADPKSPNTGGMGAYSPVPWLSDAECRIIDQRVLEPLVGFLSQNGIDYRGVLYVGLMMTAAGPYVLEFNARFGDPEAQVILPLIADDLYQWFSELAQGRLLKPQIALTGQKAVGLVLASDGYPEQPRVGRAIDIGRRVSGARIYYAGTTVVDGRLQSSGGRVLTTVGVGDDFDQARTIAYRQMAEIRLDGGMFRQDIAINLANHG